MGQWECGSPRGAAMHLRGGHHVDGGLAGFTHHTSPTRSRRREIIFWHSHAGRDATCTRQPCSCRCVLRLPEGNSHLCELRSPFRHSFPLPSRARSTRRGKTLIRLTSKLTLGIESIELSKSSSTTLVYFVKELYSAPLSVLVELNRPVSMHIYRATLPCRWEHMGTATDESRAGKRLCYFQLFNQFFLIQLDAGPSTVDLTHT
jgi:hypothetical protein